MERIQNVSEIDQKRGEAVFEAQNKRVNVLTYKKNLNNLLELNPSQMGLFNLYFAQKLFDKETADLAYYIHKPNTQIMADLPLLNRFVAKKFDRHYINSITQEIYKDRTKNYIKNFNPQSIPSANLLILAANYLSEIYYQCQTEKREFESFIIYDAVEYINNKIFKR